MSIHITAEIGTTGEYATLPLAGNLADDVAAAVELEHPCQDMAGCDIAVALENGYPLTAGYLLSGATETPLLDAVYLHHDANPHTAWEATEAALWTAYAAAHSRECESCGGYTYGDDRWRIAECGGCGAAITVTLRDLDTFAKAYAETALWAEIDPDTEEPLDNGHSIEDLAEDTLREIIEDCENFRTEVAEIITAGGFDAKTVAHNFWLTRNGHGAGFWDGGFGKHGDALTKAAKAYGDTDLYVGDDGLIYS
jgi:hypothetical protein